MKGITELSITQLKIKLDASEISSAEIVQEYHKVYALDRKTPVPINGYVQFYDDVLEAAKEQDKLRERKKNGVLCGLPLAVKDNILIKGRQATCASRILEGFTAPYSATVTGRLETAGAVFLGRTNMDEFAMGSSCEYSCYGPTRNPINRDYVPGGSSGGSAAVVAASQAPAALGSDTGGSVRLPASFCGLYGLKPGYGTLSRFGLVAYGSSLDQIGAIARDPADLGLILSVAAGRDLKDSTSREFDTKGLYPLLPAGLKGLRIALPKELNGEGIDPPVQACTLRFVDWLKKEGAVIKEISIPELEHTVAIYYIIAPAEASSNLGRYDGIEYGLRASDDELLKMYFDTRTKGFGSEVKRRIFIGNYVLSSGYYDAYYKKAQRVRSLLVREFNEVLEEADIILSPTSPTPPFRLGEKLDDPVTMYLQDICTIYANLTGLPALSIPVGKTDTTGLPVGVQISSRMNSEALLLQVAAAWHKNGGAA